MAQVSFTPNHVANPACYPSDVNGMLDLITTGGGINGTIPDNSGGGVYVGSTPPSSALTNKVWYKTDAAGRPLGTYMFYNGNWRPVPTATRGDLKWFIGSPTGLFDGTGLGILGTTEDGWALCNGQNGTPNLTNRFLVASYGFDGAGWLTNADGVARYAGGVGTNVIQANNLPPLTITAFGVHIGASGNATMAVGSENDTAVANWNVRSGGVVVGGQAALNNCPPYQSAALCMFIGFT